MYQKILVALENSRADEAVIPHVTELARKLGSELLLLHVADGWAARNYEQLKLTESQEMKDDRAYLDKIESQMRAQGIRVHARLVCGNPPTEIVKAASSEKCDLIAMTSHGHRLVGDILFGSTIHEVRHKTTIPVLLVRAEKK